MRGSVPAISLPRLARWVHNTVNAMATNSGRSAGTRKKAATGVSTAAPIPPADEIRVVRLSASQAIAKAIPHGHASASATPR